MQIPRSGYCFVELVMLSVLAPSMELSLFCCREVILPDVGGREDTKTVKSRLPYTGELVFESNGEKPLPWSYGCVPLS